MQRFILLIILGLLSSQYSFGQKSYMGYSFGLGVSNLRSSQISEEDGNAKIAYLGNAVYEKPINKQFDLNTGIQLQFSGDVFKNFTATTPEVTGDFEMLGFRLGYLSIPVVVQFHTQEKKMRPYFSGGLTGSFLILNKAKVAEYTPCFIYYDTKFSRVEFGAVGSIGFEYQYLKSAKMIVEIQGRWGLSNAVASGPIPFYNRSVCVVVGQRFRLRT